MADQDDFTFDEEENVDAPSEQDSDDWGDFKPEKQKGSKRLFYLLLLLLVLGGVAVYMFVLAPDEGPSPPIKIVNAPRKTITAPMPKAATDVKPEAVAAPAAEPVAAQPVVAETPSTPAPTAAPAAPVVDKVETAPASKPVPAQPPAEEMPKLFEKMASPAPMVAGDYTLSAGAFIMQSSVDGVSKKIRKLGYEPQISKIKRKIEMTRLLVGVYAPDVAEKKLREVKNLSSGAFSMDKGAETAVYAGSYLVLDKARVFADTILTPNGIRVTEETVKVDRTLQRVTFGSFASREDASLVSQKVAEKGLVAKPVKK